MRALLRRFEEPRLTSNDGAHRAAFRAKWCQIDWPSLYPASRFMAPAWRWLRPDGAANCVWRKRGLLVWHLRWGCRRSWGAASEGHCDGA